MKFGPLEELQKDVKSPKTSLWEESEKNERPNIDFSEQVIVQDEEDSVLNTIIQYIREGNEEDAIAKIDECSAATLNTIIIGENEETTVLAEAVAKKNLDIIKYLISKGADVHLEFEYNRYVGNSEVSAIFRLFDNDNPETINSSDRLQNEFDSNSAEILKLFKDKGVNLYSRQGRSIVEFFVKRLTASAYYIFRRGKDDYLKMAEILKDDFYVHLTRVFDPNEYRLCLMSNFDNDRNKTGKIYLRKTDCCQVIGQRHSSQGKQLMIDSFDLNITLNDGQELTHDWINDFKTKILKQCPILPTQFMIQDMKYNVLTLLRTYDPSNYNYFLDKLFEYLNNKLECSIDETLLKALARTISKNDQFNLIIPLIKKYYSNTNLICDPESLNDVIENFYSEILNDYPVEQLWRLFVDGEKQVDTKENGWQQYEKREKDCIQKMWNAFAFAIEHNDEDLSYDIYHQIHGIAGEYLAKGYRISETEFGYILNDSLTLAGILEMADPLVNLVKKSYIGLKCIDERLSYLNQRYFDSSEAEIIDNVKDIIKHYNESLLSIDKIDRVAILKNIILLASNLDRCHAFKDGNGRTSVIILNRELYKNGFPLVILENPNQLSGLSQNELFIKVIEGMRNFLYVKRKFTYPGAPTNESIQLQLLAASLDCSLPLVLTEEQKIMITKPEDYILEGKKVINRYLGTQSMEMKREEECVEDKNEVGMVGRAIDSALHTL